MQSQNKLSLLRSLLRALGLSQAAVDDIVDRILDFLSDDDERKPQAIYPYALRDDFLSRAELSFYRVLLSLVHPEVTVLTKVSLGDLFYAKSKDGSESRTYTNKIDRKHVDFLLCDRQTMQLLACVELDDSNHQRTARQARDEFVDIVFDAAGLPVHRVRVHRAYAFTELRTLRGDLAADDPAFAGALDESPDESLPVTAPAVQAATAAAVTATSALVLASNALPGESLFAGKQSAEMLPTKRASRALLRRLTASTKRRLTAPAPSPAWRSWRDRAACSAATRRVSASAWDLPRLRHRLRHPYRRRLRRLHGGSRLLAGLEAVKVWHFNDSKGTLDSNLDRHVHIGEGEIGEAGFRHILNDPRWDGIAMLLETPKENTLEEDAMNLARLCALVEDETRIPAGIADILTNCPNLDRYQYALLQFICGDLM